MKILLIGNLGYLGPVVSTHLKKQNPNYYLVGLDTGFFYNKDKFSNTLLSIDQQIYGDIRKINLDFLDSFDAYIILAGISNDPMGNEFKNITEEINYHATIKIINSIKNIDTKKVIFASSCSIYGVFEGKAKREVDELNPLTVYAKSKVGIEKALSKFKNKKTIITCLRFATACGMSPNLRLDLVLNDFVANAKIFKKIKVLSDGTPWRPLIDVKDMAIAIEWALKRNSIDLPSFLVVNTGFNNWNYQIKDLAFAVSKIIPNTVVEINNKALPDKRSYNVDFTIFEKAASKFFRKHSLEKTINELNDGLKKISFQDKNFRNSNFIRLNHLRHLIKEKKLSNNLYWTNNIS
tara:strand:- start:19 stop:1068 length:1050 start_codon:yes stop_codon:yes gene_type:complete